MKIILINGNPDSYNIDFEANINRISENLKSEGASVHVVDLKTKTIKSCNGCWGCWLKTPGECVIKDDMAEILPKVVNSDLFLLASPLILGFPSSKLKMMMDRLIPLILPYIELVNNECHHLKRYEKYPEIGLLYQPEEDTDDEDLKIVKDILIGFL